MTEDSHIATRSAGNWLSSVLCLLSSVICPLFFMHHPRFFQDEAVKIPVIPAQAGIQKRRWNAGFPPARE
jgi:hypothetical protein